MIEGIEFIRQNYGRISNSNDVALYKTMYHPDALWCPPSFVDKRGVEQIGFAYGFKSYRIHVEILELEGIDGEEASYVTGLVSVLTYSKAGAFLEKMLLRGSWLVVLHQGRPAIRYQVWNQKNA